MPIYASAGSGTKFAPAPAGTHAAVCCDVVDLGVVETTWQGQTKRKHMVRVYWQLAEPRDDGKPFLVTKRYTLSLHEKAALRHDLESWRGRAFTDAEAERFDVEALISVGCYLNVMHKKGTNGDTFANVAAIMPLPKGMQKPDIRDYTRVIDRQPDPHTAPAPDAEEFETVTADDIPFAWLLPLVLPVFGTLSLVA